MQEGRERPRLSHFLQESERRANTVILRSQPATMNLHWIES
jgi:hypothetical protein